MGHLAKTPIAPAIGRRDLPRRQPNLALDFQLQQECAAGHVFETTRLVTPVPPPAQFVRKSRPIPCRMRLETSLDQGQFFGTDTPPLDPFNEWFCQQQG